MSKAERVAGPAKTLGGPWKPLGGLWEAPGRLLGGWPGVLTVPLAVGRQASDLDRPAPSMSRGISAAHHRRWAALALVHQELKICGIIMGYIGVI